MDSEQEWNACVAREAMKTEAEYLEHQKNLLGSPQPLALKDVDAARLCGVCTRTLFNAVKRGELKCVKIGRAVRYRVQDLEAWIATKLKA